MKTLSQSGQKQDLNPCVPAAELKVTTITTRTRELGLLFLLRTDYTQIHRVYTDYTQIHRLYADYAQTIYTETQTIHRDTDYTQIHVTVSNR